MNIDGAIRLFADFLNLTWTQIDVLTCGRNYTSDESSKSDWVQANWELLVERNVLPLNKYLEVYGDGADFYAESSRITDFNACTTISIVVIVANTEDLLNNHLIISGRYKFDRLVKFTDKFYLESPPFECVLVLDQEKDIERVFLLKNVLFKLQEI